MKAPRRQPPMDIIKALRELHAEKKRLDAVIASLEAQLGSPRKGVAAPKSSGRRGRKSMSAAERLKVSKRMTLYWEARRAQLRESQGQAGQASSTSAS
jgi:hypothetical protein